MTHQIIEPMHTNNVKTLVVREPDEHPISFSPGRVGSAEAMFKSAFNNGLLTVTLKERAHAGVTRSCEMTLNRDAALALYAMLDSMFEGEVKAGGGPEHGRLAIALLERLSRMDKNDRALGTTSYVRGSAQHRLWDQVHRLVGGIEALAKRSGSSS